MARPWYQFPVTQGFNPPVEPGVDIGTPFHTLVTALSPGTVISETFGGFGARVDVATGSGKTLYYQHLDELASGLKVGSKVGLGQALGYSGGQLSGGARPNKPANSSGPHVEFGAYQGSKVIDPGAILSSIGNAAGGLAGNPAGAIGEVAGSAAGNAAATANAIAGIPTSIGHGLADFFAVSEANLAEWLKRQAVALFVAAIVLLVLFA